MTSAHRSAATLVIAVGAIALLTAGSALAAYPSAPQIADRYSPGAISVRLADMAVLPKSSSAGTSQVARINFLRAEPVAALAGQRLFANDLNGNLQILNRATNTFSTYLNFPSRFNGSGTGTFDNNPGYAAGLVTFAFDPAYATNGKFYTVHTELGPNPTEYREAVLYEWADSNINDATFTGSRAELLRVAYNDNIHPLGDIAFNPLATDASHPDYRNMYLSNGDGGAGEQSSSSLRNLPQRLDSLLGKVLRITPTASGTAGTYSVPAGNPFTSSPSGARPEIYAYGFRNPHRMSFDVDPQTNQTRLIVNDIGLHSYEEVNFVAAGGNYGYSPIEGNQVLGSNNQVNDNALPATLPLLVGSGASVGSIAPTYPVALYSHRDGDAISSGFVYRGSKIKALRGKYVFGDIANGRLFWCDYAQMLAADDGDPDTVAPIHELNLFFDSPFDTDGPESRRVFDLVRDAYDRRNELASGTTTFTGTADNDALPGGAANTSGNDPYGVAYGGGRADIRLSLIGDELYLLSKSDGMIRSIESADGDVNLDGNVDFDDLLILAQHYEHTSGVDWFSGDFDFDGVVGFADLLTLAQNYSSAEVILASDVGEAFHADWTLAGSLVPEPSMLGFAVAGLLHRRRRAQDRPTSALTTG